MTLLTPKIHFRSIHTNSGFLARTSGTRLTCLLAVICLPYFLLVLPDGSYGQDFEEWLRCEQRQYEDFRTEQNRAFADMLRRQWETMESSAPETNLDEEKPVEIPVADPVLKSEPEQQPEPEPDIKPEPKPEPEPPPPPPLPSPPSPSPPPPPPSPDTKVPTAFVPPTVDPALPTIAVDFFGLLTDIPYDPALRRISAGSTFNAQTIATIWEEMSRTEIESSVSYFEELQERLQINDWGIAQLLFATGLSLYNGDRNMARLYTWFMLIQNGYQARVGFDDDGVILMFASYTHIFGTPFFRFENVPFFIAYFDKASANPQRVFTYSSDFPGDLSPLSLLVPATPIFTPSYTRRDLSFTFKDEEIHLQVPVNKHLVAFYEFFPQTELDVYFNAPVSVSTASGLITALSRHIDGRSEYEAIHLLLRFVQTAFGYKIDPDHFGREKPLFPEETLFYDYSDCEDRAILFSFLVRELTGLNVVGLRYPGHIATAVRFNEHISGDVVDVDGDTYHVCDPTYVNAGPGMAMSRFQNTVPKIIPVNR